MSASPTPSLNLGALLEPPAQAAARRKGRVLCRRELSMSVWETDPFDDIKARFGFDESQRAQRCLHDWAHAQTTAFAFLTGCHGEGKTDLLQGLVERMARTRRRNPEAPLPLYIDLARLTNHRFGGAPDSLASALSAELARRKLPDQTQALLQAVSDGHVVLVLDHAEAIAPYHASVWRWMEELPAASTGLPCRRAHVLLCCRQEWFADMAEAVAAASKLQHAREGAHEAVYLLQLKPVGFQQEQAWLEAAGIDLTNNDLLQLAWNCFGQQNRALSARAKVLKPLFAGPPAKPPTWQEVHAAWWRHCLPTDLGLDDKAMDAHATALDLIQARQPNGELAACQHDALIERQWPLATPAQQARIAMAARVGLQLRGERGRVHLPKCHRWLALSGTRAIADGDLDTLMTALVSPPRRRAMTEAIAEAWFAAGHRSPPTRVSQWLREPQNPQATGALFELGCAMARQMAWLQARADCELLRSPTPPKSTAQYLSEALALAWPSPLSTAQLRGADLRGANFRGVPIEGADLSEADLTGTEFSQARLTRVKLDRARANAACFNEAEFIDVEADGFMAPKSSWLGARWNRRWPTADMPDAEVSVAGVKPNTTETEFRFHAAGGSAGFPLKRLVQSPNGQWIAAIGSAQTIGVWHAQGLKATWHAVLPDGPIGEVLDLCFSHDSRRVITSHADASLRGWAVADGTLTAELKRPQRALIHQIVAMRDGLHLVGFSANNQVAICDSQLNALNSHPALIGWIRSGSFGAVAERKTQGRFLASERCFMRGGITEFAPPTPRRAVKWGPKNVWRMAVGHDAQAQREWLAVLEPDGIVIGDPDADEPLWRIERSNAVIHSPAYLKLAQHAQQRMGNYPGADRSGSFLNETQAFDHEARIADLSFSPDGRWLVCVGAGHEALAVNMHTGSVHGLDDKLSAGALSAIFAPDGQLILGGNQLAPCPLPQG